MMEENIYLIVVDGEKVGATRVVDKKKRGKAKKISTIFIMNQHRNHGHAPHTDTLGRRGCCVCASVQGM